MQLYNILKSQETVLSDICKYRMQATSSFARARMRSSIRFLVAI